MPLENINKTDTLFFRLWNMVLLIGQNGRIDPGKGDVGMNGPSWCIQQYLFLIQLNVTVINSTISSPSNVFIPLSSALYMNVHR